MKILIISDLHLEWGEYRPPPPERYDAVVLAGDVRQGPKAVSWAQQEGTFGLRPVVFVAGNHEYYGLEFLQARQKLREAAHGSNVHFLDRDEFVLKGPEGERVRFLGATLWTDFAVYGHVDAAMNEARHGLNDFSGRIRLQHGVGQNSFRPEDSAEEHRLSRSWLEDRLAKPAIDGCTTVVVTHHAPSSRSIAPQWQGHDLSPCFASDLRLSFFEVPQLWVHGHVHDSLDYRLGSTRVLANPRGYRARDGAYENRRFDPSLIIDTSSLGIVDAETPVGIGEAEVLSKALRRVTRKLGLTPEVLAATIGTSSQETTAVLVDRMWLEPRSAAGTRALKIIRIFGSLTALVGYDDGARRAWLNGHTRDLDGKPVELIQTAEGLEAVVAYLERWRTT